jgi:hypothetical protein
MTLILAVAVADRMKPSGAIITIPLLFTYTPDAHGP